MVSFDTVNGAISNRPDAEHELALYIESMAKQMGFEARPLPVDEDSFNMLVELEVDDAAPWLLFDSHMDTVSVEGMTIDPFAARIENGRMYGRGACDTKSSGAAMMWALRQYAEQAERPNNVAIIYTTDEELTKSGAATFASKHISQLDWQPKSVVVGEPTMLKPVVAHNGVVRLSVRATGVAAHSCDPAKGRSAISMMVKVVDAIESRYIPALSASDPLTGKAQCSINVIHGGVGINLIPETCMIEIDRRVVPGEIPDRVFSNIEQFLGELSAADPNLNITIENIYMESPFDRKGSEGFIQWVQNVLEEMGLPAEVEGVPYGTDASNFSATAQLPTVVIGPGDIAQAHTHNEWLELEQLQGAVDVYLSMMQKPLD